MRVNREADVTVSDAGLDRLEADTSHYQPSAAALSQRMKVELLAIVSLGRKEFRFLTAGPLDGIDGLRKPVVPRHRNVSAEHPGNLCCMRQTEHANLAGRRLHQSRQLSR